GAIKRWSRSEEARTWSLTSYVSQCVLKHLCVIDHPVCGAAVASRLFIDAAASPPWQGGESAGTQPFARLLTALRGIAVALIFFTATAFAQDPQSAVLTQIGIDQKLNAPVPMNLLFEDESGATVRMGEFFHGKPVLLSLVYYECPMLCSLTLNGLVKSLRPLAFTIGNEFEVVTVSFDPNEKPDLAAAKKRGYVQD